MDPNSKEAKQQRAQEIYTRAVAAIGADGVAKLRSAGLIVAGEAEFNNFALAMMRSEKRVRDLHAASERDAGRVSARVELVMSDGQIAALVTAPTCDEAHLGTCLAEVLAPVIANLQTARFDASKVAIPVAARPPLPSVNAKGGKGLS